jgi:hypothetical protein
VAREALDLVPAARRAGTTTEPLVLSAFLLEAARRACRDHARPEAPLARGDSLIALVSEERQAEIGEILDSLPPHAREMLELALRDSLAASEIARRLGLDPEPARARRDAALRGVAEIVEGIPSSASPCDFPAASDRAFAYVQARLAPVDADAFEAHYFDCASCWELVHTGNDVRAALLSGPRVRARSRRRPRRELRHRPFFWGLLSLLAIVGWQLLCRPS